MPWKVPKSSGKFDVALPFLKILDAYSSPRDGLGPNSLTLYWHATCTVCHKLQLLKRHMRHHGTGHLVVLSIITGSSHVGSTNGFRPLVEHFWHERSSKKCANPLEALSTTPSTTGACFGPIQSRPLLARTRQYVWGRLLISFLCMSVFNRLELPPIDVFMPWDRVEFSPYAVCSWCYCGCQMLD